MWYPVWDSHGLAGPCVNAVATDLHRQGAGCNYSFFILEVMNVQRGTFLMRGQRASEFEDQLSILILPPQLEDLAGVPVLQSQMSCGGKTHGGSLPQFPGEAQVAARP